MGQVINFAKYQRVVNIDGFKRRRVEVARQSDYQEEPEPIIVSRFAARRDMHSRLDFVERKLGGLDVEGDSPETRICREELEALRPRIAEFYAYCPPTTAPFSPQASQSRASLTPEQFKHMNVLNKDLDVLAAKLSVLLPENYE